MTKILLALLIALAAIVGGSTLASGHHTGVECSPGGSKKCLPLLPTAVQRDMWQTKEIVWCTNDRGARYPGFVAQLHEVHNELAAKIGVPARQVAFGTPATTGCRIQHNMILNHGCSECAARTHFANYPILTEYNEALGYTNWRTTIAHELCHDICGGHEQYDDARFLSHLNTYGYWATDGAPGRVGSPTTLDFGTGQSLFTAWDLKITCEVNDRNGQRFTGCGYQEPPPPPTCGLGPTDPSWGGVWNSCIRRWIAPNGFSVEPGTWIWFNPQGQPEWTAANADRLRWNIQLGAWFPCDHGFFIPSRGYWSHAPSC